VSPGSYPKSSSDIRHFRDICQLAGVNRFNLAVARDVDFDGDGQALISAVTTSIRPRHGLLPERGRKAPSRSHRGRRPAGQLGGKNLQQRITTTTGRMDLSSRVAWFPHAIRSPFSEMRTGTVHRRHETGVGFTESLRSTYSAWGDYDNDGWASTPTSNQRRTSPTGLYHNRATGPSRKSRRPACRRRERLLQGVQLDRLRPRQLSGPCSSTTCKRPPPLPQTIAQHLQATSTTSMVSDGPLYADSDAGPGTTTTMAGSTSSRAHLLSTNRSRTSSRADRQAPPSTIEPASSANLGGKGFRRQDPGSLPWTSVFAQWDLTSATFDNAAFSTVPGHRRPGLGTLVPTACSERRRQKRFAESPPRLAPGSSEGTWISCADWVTGTATRHLHRDGGAP